MTGATKNWRDSVRIVRGLSLDTVMRDPAGTGRATAFEFAGAAREQTWIGTLLAKPSGTTGPHHHGRHEVAIYVVRGRAEIRWGEPLESAAEVAAGDFVYLAPYVPHQEINLSDSETVEFLVVRSDSERIAVSLDITPIETPVTVI
jgi:uncharacterized RmlC-like cupin family protein